MCISSTCVCTGGCWFTVAQELEFVFLRMEPGTGFVDPLCVEPNWNRSSTGTIQEPPNTDKIFHNQNYYGT